MCADCRDKLNERLARDKEIKAAAVQVERSFTYKRLGMQDARLDLVTRLGERLVQYEGKEPHGQWHHLADGTLEVYFNANPWKQPRKKVFREQGASGVFEDTESDPQWRVTLLPRSPGSASELNRIEDRMANRILHAVVRLCQCVRVRVYYCLCVVGAYIRRARAHTSSVR